MDQRLLRLVFARRAPKTLSLFSNSSSTAGREKDESCQSVWEVYNHLILSSNLIPISVDVTIEFQRLCIAAVLA